MTHDYGDTFREDIKGGVPDYMVLAYVTRHLDALKALPIGTKDREKAIGDVENLVAELKAKP